MRIHPRQRSAATPQLFGDDPSTWFRDRRKSALPKLLQQFRFTAAGTACNCDDVLHRNTITAEAAPTQSRAGGGPNECLGVIKRHQGCLPEAQVSVSAPDFTT